MSSDLSALVKTIHLSVPADKAFALFTAHMNEWWPLPTHSLGGDAAEKVIFEGKAGGRIYEIDAAGNERDWGEIRVYDPPRRAVFSWVLEQPKDATEVEIEFTVTGKNSCQLTLTHRGWDKRSEGVKWRGNYAQGWDGVLGLFQKAVP